MISPNIVVAGLLIGVLYSLISVGLTLQLGVMKIVNFGYGGFIVLSSYFCSYLWTMGMDPIITLIPSVVLLVVIGVLIQRFIFTRLPDNENFQLMITLGLALIISGSLLQFFGVAPVGILNDFTMSFVHVGPLDISNVLILSTVFAGIMISSLYYLLKRTQTGINIRATADDPITAAMLGINVDKVRTLTAAVSFGFAAVAGLIIVMLYSITPLDSTNYVLIAFIVCVLGGLGSIKGALISGVILGELSLLMSFFIGPWTKGISIFIIFVIFVLIRPAGLFGASGE